MRLAFPKRHKHTGPPISVEHDYMNNKTRVLRKCTTCSSAFTTKIKGRWSLSQIRAAEGVDADGGTPYG